MQSCVGIYSETSPLWAPKEQDDYVAWARDVVEIREDRRIGG